MSITLKELSPPKHMPESYLHVYTLYTQEKSIPKKRNWYFWWEEWLKFHGFFYRYCRKKATSFQFVRRSRCLNALKVGLTVVVNFVIIDIIRGDIF